MRATLARVPLLAQVTGGASVVAGFYLAFGLAVALIVGGVIVAGLGTLREAGWI